MNYSINYTLVSEIVMYFDQQVFSGKTKRHLTLFYHNSQRKNLFSKKKEIKRPAITILGEVIF